MLLGGVVAGKVVVAHPPRLQTMSFQLSAFEGHLGMCCGMLDSHVHLLELVVCIAGAMVDLDLVLLEAEHFHLGIRVTCVQDLCDVLVIGEKFVAQLLLFCSASLLL